MTERLLIAEIHKLKAQRMKAQIAGDLVEVSALSTRIGELTREVWKLRTQAERGDA